MQPSAIHRYRGGDPLFVHERRCAQNYGVGLIATRLPGLAFEVGIFVGQGGILVRSFLGEMRAVAWLRVAKYTILIIAYLVPGGVVR